MAPSLLVRDGPAFQTYLAQDPKLLKESPAIPEQIATEVVQAQPQIVLVAGDLTKDGERVSHDGVVPICNASRMPGQRSLSAPATMTSTILNAVSFDDTATNTCRPSQAQQLAPLAVQALVATTPETSNRTPRPKRTSAT